MLDTVESRRSRRSDAAWPASDYPLQGRSLARAREIATAEARMSGRRHEMPFGATLRDGGARFRLWAPARAAVDLRACQAGATCCRWRRPMRGWYEVFVHRGRRTGSRLRYRHRRRRAVPDPASRYQPRDVHGPSEVVDPARVRVDRRGLARPAVARGGDLRAARRHLHRRRYLRGGDARARPPGDAGRDRHRADAGRGFSRHAQLGLRRRAALRARARLRRAGGSEAARRRSARARPHGVPRRRLQPLRARRQLSRALRAAVLHRAHQTPWGRRSISTAGGTGTVRDFFVHNALYWLEEYHLDGLRLDAVHAIADDARAAHPGRARAAVAPGPGAPARHVHLVLENDDNARMADRCAAGLYDAQWNDDLHHALHVLLTGETDGYYADYAERPSRTSAAAWPKASRTRAKRRALRGRARGEPCADLPPPPSSIPAEPRSGRQPGVRRAARALAAPRRCAAATACCCWRLRCRCSSWARSGRRRAVPLLLRFQGRARRAVREGRRREFARFPASPTRRSASASRSQRARDVRGELASTAPPRRTRRRHRAPSRLLAIRHARSSRASPARAWRRFEVAARASPRPGYSATERAWGDRQSRPRRRPARPPVASWRETWKRRGTGRALGPWSVAWRLRHVELTTARPDRIEACARAGIAPAYRGARGPGGSFPRPLSGDRCRSWDRRPPPAETPAAPPCYRPDLDGAGRAGLGRRRAALRGPLLAQLGHRRFHRPPLLTGCAAGAAPCHRPQSPARALRGGTRASVPMPGEPPVPQRSLPGRRGDQTTAAPPRPELLASPASRLRRRAAARRAGRLCRGRRRKKIAILAISADFGGLRQRAAAPLARIFARFLRERGQALLNFATYQALTNRARFARLAPVARGASAILPRPKSSLAREHSPDVR